jgi:hypothetical protein
MSGFGEKQKDHRKFDDNLTGEVRKEQIVSRRDAEGAETTNYSTKETAKDAGVAKERVTCSNLAHLAFLAVSNLIDASLSFVAFSVIDVSILQE